MLKAIIELFESNRKKVGNHSREDLNYTPDNVGYTVNVSRFKYHNSTLCRIDWIDKTCTLDDCGWRTCSTTRALNDYEQYVKDHFPELKILNKYFVSLHYKDGINAIGEYQCAKNENEIFNAYKSKKEKNKKKSSHMR